jgi:hypothetical protein
VLELAFVVVSFGTDQAVWVIGLLVVTIVVCATIRIT